MKQTMTANHTNLSIPSQHGQLVVFYYEYPNDYGCPQRDYDTVLVDSIAKCPTLRILPNPQSPLQDHLAIQPQQNGLAIHPTAPTTHPTPIEVRILDLAGRTLFHLNQSPPITTHAPLPKGIYILEIRSNDQILRRRIIVR